jgi:hypothetical protein
MKLVTPKRRSWRDGTRVIRIRVREEDLATMREDRWLVSRSEWGCAAVQMIAELIQQGYSQDLVDAQVLICGAKAGLPFGPPSPIDPQPRQPSNRRGLKPVPDLPA